MSSTTASEVVDVHVEDRVAMVTLNRPDARNALNSALRTGLWDAIASAGDDEDVDVVVLTGADPAFCAGIDLKELAGGGAGGDERPRRDVNGLYRYFPRIDKPVIGAINGVAVTGGLEVALQCTLLVASERARFADTHGRVGIMPGGGVTVLLAQTIGIRKAIELSLTGNFLDAQDALRLGLVNHVVPHDDLLPAALRLAADVVGNDQRSVRRLLQHYRAVAAAGSLDEAHLLEGCMAETWQPPTDLGARRDAVVSRGREQGGASTGGAS